MGRGCIIMMAFQLFKQWIKVILLLACKGGQDAGNVYLLKTNVVGDTLWSKSYNKYNGSAAYSVAQTFDTGFIIMGFANIAYFSNHYIPYIIKTKSNGDTIWTKTFDFTQRMNASIIQTIDSGFLFTGYENINSNNSDVLLVKLNAQGALLWKKRYGGLNFEGGNCVIQNADNGFTITGYTTSLNPI